MPFVDNNGVRIYWNEKGSGSPLVLVMGAAFSSRMWYPAIDALAETHRVIWLDNRGIGESAPTRTGTISDMVSDVIAVMNAAAVERAHVYGVSLGGVIVQELALQHPDRVTSIILGCTGMLVADHPRAPRAITLLAFLPRRVLARFATIEAYGPACPAEAARNDLEFMKAEKRSRRGLIQQQDALRAYVITTAQAATLTMPALVLHGTADTTVAHDMGKLLADTLPDARFISYEGAGHNFPVAMGERVNEDVSEFLAEVDASVAA